LHEDQYTFLIISRSVVLRMRNVSDGSCREKTRTILYSLALFEDRAVCEIVWKNVERAGEATYYCMVHAHCMLEN
jgi:hypothetical protein